MTAALWALAAVLVLALAVLRSALAMHRAAYVLGCLVAADAGTDALAAALAIPALAEAEADDRRYATGPDTDDYRFAPMPMHTES